MLLISAGGYRNVIYPSTQSRNWFINLLITVNITFLYLLSSEYNNIYKDYLNGDSLIT